MASPYDAAQYRTNRAIVLAGSPICSLCGQAIADTVDHIIPLSRGGDHSLANLRPACTSCNSSRGARVKTRYKARY